MGQRTLPTCGRASWLLLIAPWRNASLGEFIMASRTPGINDAVRRALSAVSPRLTAITNNAWGWMEECRAWTKEPILRS